MNYYELLEIESTATNSQIKAAYRKKAKEHHPDHGGDPEVFKEIQAAYECLSSPEEREFYDRTGAAKGSDLMNKIASMIREVLNNPNPIKAITSGIVSARADCNIRIRQFDDRTLKLAKKRDLFIKLNSNHALFPVFIGVIDAELNSIAQQKQSFQDGLQEIAQLERMFAGLVEEQPVSSYNFSSANIDFKQFERLFAPGLDDE